MENVAPVVFVGSQFFEEYYVNVPNELELAFLLWKQYNHEIDEAKFYAKLNKIDVELKSENPSWTVLEREKNSLKKIRSIIATEYNNAFFNGAIVIENFTQKNAYKTKTPPIKQGIAELLKGIEWNKKRVRELHSILKTVGKSQYFFTRTYTNAVEDSFIELGIPCSVHTGREGFFEESPDQVNLYKLDGSINLPDSILYTDDDKVENQVNRELMVAKIQSFKKEKTFLLLGYDVTSIEYKKLATELMSGNSQLKNIMVVHYTDDSQEIVVEKYYDETFKKIITRVETGSGEGLTSFLTALYKEPGLDEKSSLHEMNSEESNIIDSEYMPRMEPHKVQPHSISTCGSDNGQGKSTIQFKTDKVPSVARNKGSRKKSWMAHMDFEKSEGSQLVNEELSDFNLSLLNEENVQDSLIFDFGENDVVTEKQGCFEKDPKTMVKKEPDVLNDVPDPEKRIKNEQKMDNKSGYKEKEPEPLGEKMPKTNPSILGDAQLEEDYFYESFTSGITNEYRMVGGSQRPSFTADTPTKVAPGESDSREKKKVVPSVKGVSLKKSRLGKQGKQNKKKEKRKVQKHLIGAVVGATAAVIVLSFVNFSPAIVEGESMMPTLTSNDYVLLMKPYGNLHHFEVVAFNSPDSPGKQYIKRIIGLPGDEIEVRNDVLYINGHAQTENYLEAERKDLGDGERLTKDFSLKELTGVEKVPKEKVFVMGDNRLYSRDSRTFGYIDVSEIEGKANLVVWPVDNMKKITIK